MVSGRSKTVGLVACLNQRESVPKMAAILAESRQSNAVLSITKYQ